VEVVLVHGYCDPSKKCEAERNQMEWKTGRLSVGKELILDLPYKT
jgi:hypothetical protein